MGRWNGIVFSMLLLAFSYIVSGNDGLMSFVRSFVIAGRGPAYSGPQR